MVVLVTGWQKEETWDGEVGTLLMYFLTNIIFDCICTQRVSLAARHCYDTFTVKQSFNLYSVRVLACTNKGKKSWNATRRYWNKQQTRKCSCHGITTSEKLYVFHNDNITHFSMEEFVKLSNVVLITLSWGGHVVGHCGTCIWQIVAWENVLGLGYAEVHDAGRTVVVDLTHLSA